MPVNGLKKNTFHMYIFLISKSPYVWKAAIWLQKSLKQKVRSVLEIEFTGQFENVKIYLLLLQNEENMQERR